MPEGAKGQRVDSGRQPRPDGERFHPEPRIEFSVVKIALLGICLPEIGAGGTGI
jgi:hypothetical protein